MSIIYSSYPLLFCLRCTEISSDNRLTVSRRFCTHLAQLHYLNENLHPPNSPRTMLILSSPSIFLHSLQGSMSWPTWTSVQKVDIDQKANLTEWYLQLHLCFLGRWLGVLLPVLKKPPRKIVSISDSGACSSKGLRRHILEFITISIPAPLQIRIMCYCMGNRGASFLRYPAGYHLLPVEVSGIYGLLLHVLLQNLLSFWSTW